MRHRCSPNCSGPFGCDWDHPPDRRAKLRSAPEARPNVTTPDPNDNLPGLWDVDPERPLAFRDDVCVVSVRHALLTERGGPLDPVLFIRVLGIEGKIKIPLAVIDAARKAAEDAGMFEEVDD
jgi:hypothetical protein